MRLRKVGRKTGIIIGAVAVAVAVVVLNISSYWVGSRVEQQFRESMDLLTRYGDEHDFKVIVVDYQRSVFSATARTDLVLKMTSQNTPSVAEEVIVPIIHNIRHGPVFALAAAARIRSEATEEGIAQYRKIFGADSSEDEVLPVFETVVGLTGKKHLHVSSPGLEATFKGIQIREDQGDGEIRHPGLVLDIVIDGPSRIEHDEGILLAGRLTFKSSMAPATGFKRVYVGTTDLVLDKIQLQWKGENGAVRNLESENFRVSVDASIKDGAMDTEVKFDADKISVEEETKETADSLKLTLLMENFDVSAYDAILQTMDQDDQTAEVLEKQREILLRRKRAFHIKEASGRWPEGVATGSFRIVYEGEAKPDDLSISNLSGLSGDLQLVLPRALVTRHISSQVSRDISDSLEDGEENEVNVEKETAEEVGRKMTDMLEKGIFVEKGDTLAVDARLRDGELHLNGKPQPIQTLLELLPPFFF